MPQSEQFGWRCCSTGNNKWYISRTRTTDNKLHCNEAQSDSLPRCSFARAQLHIQPLCSHVCVRERARAYPPMYRQINAVLIMPTESRIQNVQECIVDYRQRSEMNRSFDARRAHRLFVTLPCRQLKSTPLLSIRLVRYDCSIYSVLFFFLSIPSLSITCFFRLSGCKNLLRIIFQSTREC